jgi:hypothetical protein
MKPAPESLFPWGTQARRLYEALATCGEVTNVQIVRDLHILTYSKVIGQIRKAVRPFGLDVAKRNYGRGVWAYRLAVIQQQAA